MPSVMKSLVLIAAVTAAGVAVGSGTAPAGGKKAAEKAADKALQEAAKVGKTVKKSVKDFIKGVLADPSDSGFGNRRPFLNFIRVSNHLRHMKKEGKEASEEVAELCHKVAEGKPGSKSFLAAAQAALTVAETGLGAFARAEKPIQDAIRTAGREAEKAGGPAAAAIVIKKLRDVGKILKKGINELVNELLSEFPGILSAAGIMHHAVGEDVKEAIMGSIGLIESFLDAFIERVEVDPSPFVSPAAVKIIGKTVGKIGSGRNDRKDGDRTDLKDRIDCAVRKDGIRAEEQPAPPTTPLNPKQGTGDAASQGVSAMIGVIAMSILL